MQTLQKNYLPTHTGSHYWYCDSFWDCQLYIIIWHVRPIQTQVIGGEGSIWTITPGVSLILKLTLKFGREGDD